MADAPTPLDQTPDPHEDQQGENLDTDRVITDIPDRPVSFDRGTTVAEQKAGPSLEGRTNAERPDITADPERQATPLVDDAESVEEGGLGDHQENMVPGSRTEEDVDDSGHPTPPPSAEEVAVRDRGSEAPGGIDRRGL